jgi:superkiller protein 3
VTRQVKCEAISKFHIEERYAALIDWTRDDDTRHDLEQKWFQRMFDSLLVIPQEGKPAQRDKVLNMANGMVIIRQPFPLAWKVALEWVDAEDLQEWDVNLFHEYIGYFPDDGLSKVLRGFLDSDASPFPRAPVEEVDGEEKPERLSEADQLILMTEGLEDCPESLLGHRIMAHVYLHLKEWESTVEAARKAQKLHLDARQRYAVDLQNSLDSVNLILANALITFQALADSRPVGSWPDLRGR